MTLEAKRTFHAKYAMEKGKLKFTRNALIVMEQVILMSAETAVSCLMRNMTSVTNAVKRERLKRPSSMSLKPKGNRHVTYMYWILFAI